MGLARDAEVTAGQRDVAGHLLGGWMIASRWAAPRASSCSVIGPPLDPGADAYTMSVSSRAVLTCTL
jgi:hypothetical protein